MEYMILQGKQIPYERSTISVAQSELDPKNPRTQYLIGQHAGSATETELEEMLWQKDSVKALANSIFQNGGVYDPVIVQRHDGKYLVREGNSRTVACRRLLVTHPEDERFMNLPALIFDIELTEEDLAVMLADMHVAGKIRWDAYEQAKHVHDLHHVYGKTYDWLGNHLRLGKSKINELLLAYTATSEFLAIHPDPNNVRKFSFFQELMKKRELRDRFKDEPEFKQRFHNWLVSDRLTDSKQIRNLPMILGNAEATEALDATGISQATTVLMKNDPSLENGLFRAIKIATSELNATPVSDIQDLKSGNPQKTIMLRNLHRAIEDLATLAQVKL